MDNVKLPDSLADHPSLVGIVRMPFSTGTTYLMNVPVVMKDEENNYYSGIQVVEMNETINQVQFTDAPFTISKNKITDFYPYTYYVLTDGECEPLIMLPQHMPTNCYLKGKFALSHQPVERYYIQGYKGDSDGRIYNITNTSQMMLPTGTNEGINFLNSNANATLQNKKNTVLNTVLGATSSLISGNIGMAIGGTIGGITAIQSANARLQDTMLTPSSISSYGTPSTRNAFGNNEVRVLKYSVKDNVKNKVNSFVERYGNKFNNYDTIDIKSYKGYIKFIQPNIDSKIDNMHINKIIEILERGVYIE